MWYYLYRVDGFMLENEVSLFKKYVSDYNLNEESIENKYNHSLRVMNHSIMIAKSLRLDKDDVKLAGIIGLLHDIGRFYQWRAFHTYNDVNTIDHGNKGVEILKIDNYIRKYLDDERQIDILFNAVLNHNKISINNNLDEKTILFCKIIRDADKIDIMEYVLNNEIERGIMCSFDVEGFFKKRKLLKDNNVSNVVDAVIRMLGFIYDINTSYAVKYILNNHIIEKKIDLLSCHVDKDVDLEKIKIDLIEYLKKKWYELWQEEKK